MNNGVDLKSIVAEVKNAYSIEDYINQNGVILKRSSGNKLKGICPFHTEKTPSFTVDVQFQNYYCWGCKKHGDIISFVIEQEKFTFIEALKLLASDKGIEVVGSDQPSVDYKSLHSILRDTAKYFLLNFKKLNDDHPAKAEIAKRGIPLDTLHFGYAPEKRNDLCQFLKKRGYSEDLIVEAGVARKGEHGLFDFWSGRLMFIITDIQGRPVGFSGRKLYESDKLGKYVNSPEGPLFDKGSILFNTSRARKQAAHEKTLYVVEGQFDVAAFVAAESSNVVASSGTAFTRKQAQVCLRLINSDDGKVVFCFDGDEAGVKAAFTAFERAPFLHSNAFVVSFPSDLDPSDYMKKHGTDEFMKYVNDSQISLIDYVLKKVLASSNTDTSVGRAQFLKLAAQKLAFIQNRSLLEAAIRSVALDSMSTFDSVFEEVKKSRENMKDQNSRLRDVEEEDQVEDSRPEMEASVDEEQIIEMIKTNKLYLNSAKLISLSVSNAGLVKALVKYSSIIPEELRGVISNLSESTGRIILEDFDQFKVADYIFDPDFSPLVESMTDTELMEHFKFLLRIVRSEGKRISKESQQQKILSTLASGKDSKLEDLKRALEAEKNLR